MIDPKIIELINENLDGQISGSKRAQLRRHLESNPEARAYADELESLKTAFGRLVQVEPPQSLKIGILNAIRASGKPEQARPGFFDTIVARISSPAIPRYGFAVVGGICLGMLLFAVFIGGIDTGGGGEQVSGSMGTVVSPARTVTDYALFEGASVSSSVQVVASGDRILIEAEVESAESNEFGVTFPSEAYAMIGVRCQKGMLQAVTAQGGSLTATATGSARLTVELERKGENAPVVRLQLRRHEHVLWERALQTSPAP